MRVWDITTEDVKPGEYQHLEMLAKAAHIQAAQNIDTGRGFEELMADVEIRLKAALEVLTAGRAAVHARVGELLEADNYADLDELEPLHEAACDRLVDALAPLTELNSLLLQDLVRSMSEERQERRAAGEIYGTQILPPKA